MRHWAELGTVQEVTEFDGQRYERLKRQAMMRFSLAAIVIPLILYLLAGTLHYWQGWLYWTVLVLPMIVAVRHLLKRDPELLERRMIYREEEKEQRSIVSAGALVVMAGFVAVAVDLRLHGLDAVPIYWTLVANAVVFFGYMLVLWVFKENSYAARTIQVAERQKVISTGPYAVVRHPMYLGVLAMYLATPIALGSWWAAPIFALNIPIIVWRIIAEERMLLRDLPGYLEYCQKRRYRLLPLVW